MAISPPAFQKDALPSRQGWRHPRTGELLVSRPMSEEQIDEYLHATAQETSPPDVEFIIDVSEDVVDWDVDYDDYVVEELDLDSMTKAELIETAEDWEVDIDKKGTKAEIKAHLEEELFD